MDLRIQLLIAALATVTAIILLAKAVIEFKASQLKLKSADIPQAPKKSAATTSTMIRILNAITGRVGRLIPILSLILLVSQVFAPVSKGSIFIMVCSAMSVVSWLVVLLEVRFNRLTDTVIELAQITKDGLLGSLDIQREHVGWTRDLHESTKRLEEGIGRAEQGAAEQPAISDSIS